ncbi:MAG: hypothetical protein ACE15B_09515 [Bryobacteraceae bacterium]
MENFRFTLFNGLTLFVMALTVATALARLARRRGSNWPLAYYALLLAFALGFPYSLNPYVIGAGAALALAIRFGRPAAPVRVAEYGVLAYVMARSVALLLLW